MYPSRAARAAELVDDAAHGAGGVESLQPQYGSARFESPELQQLFHQGPQAVGVTHEHVEGPGLRVACDAAGGEQLRDVRHRGQRGCGIRATRPPRSPPARVPRHARGPSPRRMKYQPAARTSAATATVYRSSGRRGEVSSGVTPVAARRTSPGGSGRIGEQARGRAGRDVAACERRPDASSRAQSNPSACAAHAAERYRASTTRVLTTPASGDQATTAGRRESVAPACRVRLLPAPASTPIRAPRLGRLPHREHSPARPATSPSARGRIELGPRERPAADKQVVTQARPPHVAARPLVRRRRTRSHVRPVPPASLAGHPRPRSTACPDGRKSSPPLQVGAACVGRAPPEPQPRRRAGRSRTTRS